MVQEHHARKVWYTMSKTWVPKTGDMAVLITTNIQNGVTSVRKKKIVRIGKMWAVTEDNLRFNIRHSQSSYSLPKVAQWTESFTTAYPVDHPKVQESIKIIKDKNALRHFEKELQRAIDESKTDPQQGIRIAAQTAQKYQDYLDISNARSSRTTHDTHQTGR